MARQALLRQTVKKMSLQASHGSVRSSNSGNKLSPEKFDSNPVLPYGNCGLISAHPLTGKEDYKGSGHKDLEEGRLVEEEDVLLYSQEGVGEEEATGSVTGERSQEEGEEEVVA